MQEPFFLLEICPAFRFPTAFYGATNIRSMSVCYQPFQDKQVIALFNAPVLIGWAQYNQRRLRVERRNRRPRLALQEVAQSFAITPEDVQRLNRHDVLKVHHDEYGHIIDVETLRERS